MKLDVETRKALVLHLDVIAGLAQSIDRDSRNHPTGRHGGRMILNHVDEIRIALQLPIEEGVRERDSSTRES